MHTIKTLKNGLRIISEPLTHVRSVSLGIWVKNGSRYETPAESGISHFIEHMLFKGTDTRTAEEIAGEMDALGGGVNAFTTKECTAYYVKTLDTHLRKAAEILCDMFFHSKFDEKDVSLERGVIEEEIDMYEDTPEDVAIEKLFEACYGSHPLGQAILGTKESLATITGETMKAYIQRHYHPSQTLVAISGSYTPEDIDYIAALFEDMEGDAPNIASPATYEKSFVLRPKDIEQNHICLGYPGVDMESPDKYALQILSNILGGGMSSRLFQTVREQHGLCYSVYSFPSAHLTTGMFQIYAALNKKTEDKALSLILDLVDKFKTEGPTEEELSRSREQVKINILMGLESTGNRMTSIGKGELFFGEIVSPEELISRYDRVTAEDIRKLAQQIFDPTMLSLSVVGKLQSEAHYKKLLER